MRKPLYLLVTILLCLSVSSAFAAGSVKIVAPPNGATINGSQVEIVVNFSSTENLPVSKVEVLLDGMTVTQRTFDPSLAGGSCTFRWDTTRTPNGNHTVDVTAFAGGQTIGSAKCDVLVQNGSEDRMGPKVSIISPKEGQVVSGTTPIVVQSTDDDGMEPFVSISVDGSIRSVSNRTPYILDWDTTQQQNGPCMIDASSMDSANNQTKAKSVRVIIRNPVKQTSIASQSVDSLPITTEVATSKPVSAVASAAKSAGSQEAARVATDASVAEQFEAGVKAGELSASATVPAAQPVALPAAETVAESAAAVSVPAQVADAPKSVAQSSAKVSDVAALPVQSPVLIAKALPFESASPVAKAESKLAAPAVPAQKLASKPKAATKSIDAPVLLVSLPKSAATKPEIKVTASAKNLVASAPKSAAAAKATVPANTKDVRIRPVFENAGGTVTWDHFAKTVHAVSSTNDVKLTIGSSKAQMNDVKVNLGQPAYIIDGRTMVPSNFVTKTLGMAK